MNLNIKSWVNIKPETKAKIIKAGETTLKVLKVCQDIALKCPTSKDNVYAKIIKTAAIAESAYRLTIKDTKSINASVYIAKKYNAQLMNSQFLTSILSTSGILEEFPVVSDYVPELSTIFKIIELKNGGKIIFCQKESEMPEAQFFHTYFYVTAGFDYEELFAAIWKKYNNAIAVDYVSVKGFSKEIRLLPSNVDLSFTSQLAKDRINELNDFSVGNCVLVVGSPGTGKSSFAHMFAAETNKKIFKFTGTIFENGDVSEVCSLIQFLGPDVCLIDDCDRTTLANANSNSLYLFEIFHQQMSNILFLLTANYPERLEKAVLRTGRIDYIMEFEAPTDEERKQIIKHFSKELVYSEEQLQRMTEETKDFSHADTVGFIKRANKFGLEQAIASMQRLNAYKNKGKMYED